MRVHKGVLQRRSLHVLTRAERTVEVLWGQKPMNHSNGGYRSVTPFRCGSLPSGWLGSGPAPLNVGSIPL